MWSNHQWQLIQTSLIHSYLLKIIIILICHVQSTSTLIQWHHLLDIFVVFLISGMYTISSQNCPSLIIHLESSVSEVALWIHVQIQYCSLAIQRLGSYKLNSFKDPCDYPESMSQLYKQWQITDNNFWASCMWCWQLLWLVCLLSCRVQFVTCSELVFFLY